MDRTLKEIDGPLLFLRPQVCKGDAIQLAEEQYGFKFNIDSVSELESYDDRNFYMKGIMVPKQPRNDKMPKEEEYVLKILNHADSANASFVDSQNCALLYLKKHGFSCPTPVMSLSGEYKLSYDLSKLTKPSKRETFSRDEGLPRRLNCIRLLTFVRGRRLADLPCSAQFLVNLGHFVAKLDKVLEDFSHPGLANQGRAEWDLTQISVLESYIDISSRQTSDEMRRNLTYVYFNFVSNVLPNLQYFKKQVIHGDLNDTNIIVTSCSDVLTKFGVLDFGDMSLSYRLFELAICMAYVILIKVQQGYTCKEAIKMAGHVLCGYQREFGLQESALDLLYWSVAGRLFQSIVIGLHKQSLEPENEYLRHSANLSYTVLASFISFSEKELLESWLLVTGAHE